MKSAEIRRAFLEFYESKEHTRVRSGSLVPSSYDPSVLLTTAGMQPFKPFFLGLEEPPAPRLTSCQKCFRTPDIDQVGSTDRHLTFFEMLGNFSFGDYFKERAVELAWEFVTEELKLDQQKLWATVFEGDTELGVGEDDETIGYWENVGIPRERIVPLGEDNFWKAGPTGPCGPCSEIYFDRGAEFGCGSATCAPGCECDRYLEFYNLVFMQYDRHDDGTLTPLPNQNIDTGLGLERVSALMQGNVSVFEIDSFRAIIEWVEQIAGVSYGDNPVATKALRVLADHARAMAFLASDGVLPSNEGRGYVLRRVIRRAIQQAERIGILGDTTRTFADGGGFLAGLTQRVVEEFGEHYPELVQQREAVADILNAEEERFLATLSNGTRLLKGIIQETREGGGHELSADVAFQLHDTYGFPIELTTEIASEAGLSVNRARFEELMREQRERARAGAGGSDIPADAVAAFARTGGSTSFVGYDTLEVTTTVRAVDVFERSQNGAQSDQTPSAGSRRLLLKLAESPFYPEGGGQVSDAGSLIGPRGRAEVVRVLRFEDDQVIVAEVDGEFAVGDEVLATVRPEHRLPTQLNHTATHLLHAALRERLGEHVRQAGSLVAPDRLRFDFTHPHALSPDDLHAIENWVNERIASNAHVGWSELALDEAREAGAMMLFGEKYGDRVRMVDIGDGLSRELCGGTHVTATGQIRLMVIVAESSVGANTRRIEALTGDAAVNHLRERALVAERAAAAAHVEIERLPERVEELTRQNRALDRELSKLRSGADLEQAAAQAERVESVNLVVYRSDTLSPDELLELSDRLKSKLAPAAVLVGGAHDGKVSLIANVSDDANQAGVDANQLIRHIAGIVGGGGGGRPTMSRAGGKDPSRLDEALEQGRRYVRELLASPKGA